MQLPPGEGLNEWLAINTVDFYNTTNLLYGAISEFCTGHVCPVMSAGEKFEYLWMDGRQYKRPTKLSAPDYISCLMDWIAVLINNDEIFPADPSTCIYDDHFIFTHTHTLTSCCSVFLHFSFRTAKFTKQFVPSVKNIFKRMFRVYAHLYYSHYQDMKDLGIERHLNTAFKHFMLFVFEFDLIDKKELVPLKATITALTGHSL